MAQSKTLKRLRLNEFKLDSLLEITKAINSNSSTPKLLNTFRSILSDELNVGSITLFSNDGAHWRCVLDHGDRNTGNIDVEKDLLHLREITLGESAQREHIKAFDIVIPVIHKTTPLAYLLLGDLDESELKISPIIKHLPFIQTLANIIMVAVENKRLHNEKIKQEGIKKELELASEVQNMLFPDRLPNDEKLEIAAYYQPHQQVGGDYYDFIHLNEDEVIFCLADVSGKGVSAALLMANFQAHLRALVNYYDSLTQLITELNARVLQNTKGEKFITIFLARYNTKTRTLKYINAAHNPPILKRGNTTYQLTLGCTGLGMFDEIPQIKEGEINVPKGSLLVCYTDGLVELENEYQEDFGLEKLEELVYEHQGSMNQLNADIIHNLDRFKGKMPYIDDVALFSCRFL